MHTSTNLNRCKRVLILVRFRRRADRSGGRSSDQQPPTGRTSAMSRPGLSLTPATVVSRPADVQDAATSLSAVSPRRLRAVRGGASVRLSTSASTALITPASPPDVQDAATTLHATAGDSQLRWFRVRLGATGRSGSAPGFGLALLVGIRADGRSAAAAAGCSRPESSPPRTDQAQQRGPLGLLGSDR